MANPGLLLAYISLGVATLAFLVSSLSEEFSDIQQLKNIQCSRPKGYQEMYVS